MASTPARYPQPQPGQPVPRGGKPYIWATWLAKLLGGDQCVWSVWFKAHHKYAKLPEKDAEKLVEWNREHSAMMRERRRELEESGWEVVGEREFKLEGQTAIIAGKEDLAATMPGHILVVDGKTGKRRDSDFWQLVIYLYARLHQPAADPDSKTKLAGEVQYHGSSVDVSVSDVLKHEGELVAMVKAIASDTPPSRNPSKYECGRCNIGPADCPVRYQERTADDVVHTGAF